MAELLLDVQGKPAAPAAGQLFAFPHTSSKRWASEDDTGRVLTFPHIYDVNVADVVANAADTYLIGLPVPSHLLQAKALFRWRLMMSKTGAGVAAPTWNIRVGAAGTVADTSRVLFTSPLAQTAVIDNGVVEITAILRNIGAAAVLAAYLEMRHLLAATGLAAGPRVDLQVTSAGFDSTVANLIVGLSVNPGAAGVWTHQLISAEVLGL